MLPWLVLTRTGDPAVTGLVAAVAALPAILAALVGGWLIDKVGQRRMSVLSDLGSALSVAGLAVVDRVFGLDLGWFIALGILGALFDVPGMTARETLMGRVAPDEWGVVGQDRLAPAGGVQPGLPRWPGAGRDPAGGPRSHPGGLGDGRLLLGGRRSAC